MDTDVNSKVALALVKTGYLNSPYFHMITVQTSFTYFIISIIHYMYFLTPLSSLGVGVWVDTWTPVKQMGLHGACTCEKRDTKFTNYWIQPIME